MTAAETTIAVSHRADYYGDLGPRQAQVLQRRDTNQVPETAGERRAFLLVRDEALRLPWILDYYRRLGIDRFFMVENGSTDGTLDLLLGQRDCHVFWIEGGFIEARHGLDWLNTLLERYGYGHWCLTVDADEVLVYPGSEHLKLPELCAFLDRSGADGLFTFLLDMYARGPVSETAGNPGESLLGLCPYFDREYRFRRRLGLPIPTPASPREDVVGGPRLRRFYPEFHRFPLLWKLAAGTNLAIHLLERATGRSTPIRVSMPPPLAKVPLIRWRKELRYLDVTHRVTPLRLAEVTGALLHFKFLSDFHGRTQREATRPERKIWDSGSYARYVRGLRREPDLDFFYEGSVRYEDTGQLRRLGLIRSSPELDALATAAAS